MRLIGLFFLLICHYLASAQDSLVRFSDLHYTSEFEEASFRQYITSDRINPFYFFLAVDTSMTVTMADDYKEKYEKALHRMRNTYNGKLTPKKMQKLYDNVHQVFLTQYVAKNSFSQVFASGSYNCVSSSALYGLIFTDLGIPFLVKEQPTHVYLLSYPDTDQIIIETTDPTGSFLKHTNRYKATVVEQLKDAKLISQQEFDSRPADELFNQYYLPDGNIGLKELIGLQYMNDALYRLDQTDRHGAYRQLEKAYFFYPKKDLAILLTAVAAEILETGNYASEKSMHYLARLSRPNTPGITPEHIKGEFERMTAIVLTEKGDSLRYRRYYEAFMTQSTTAEIKSSISYLYNLRQGLAWYKAGDYQKALVFLGNAYALNSENLDISSLFINTIGQKLQIESNIYTVIEELETYSRKYPSLLENSIFKSTLLNSYATAFGQAFDLDDEKNGLNHYKLFQTHYDKNLPVNQSIMGRAYSLMAVFYFKKGQKVKARSIIEEGLQHAPGNYELQTRLRMIR